MQDAIFKNTITLSDGRIAVGREQYNASGQLTGMVYEPIPELQNPTAATPYSKAAVLPDNVCAALGIPLTSEPKDAFRALASGIPWQKIATFNAIGAFTWTAPDLNNLHPYEIGVFIIGGGGSGGCTNPDSYAGATGGAGGATSAFTMVVSPYFTYNVVVGAGAIGVTVGKNGETGGTSSFDGKTALGGGGGFQLSGSSVYDNVVGGASGGQASDSIIIRRTITTNAPFDGMTPIIPIAKNTYTSPQTNPKMSVNPFSYTEKYLAAGGGASYENSGSTPYIQQGSAVTHGVSGGGKVSSSSSGNNATGYGNGGGALCLSEYNTSAVSGAGAPGAVLIYARKADTV